MEKAVKNFAKQFEFKPILENENRLKPAKSFVLAGMGGSHLAGGILKIWKPEINLFIHRDYGIPPMSEEKSQESLFIASSYSGNTEEVLDFASKAFAKGYNLAVVAVGGELLEFAKTNNLPYVALPNDGIQPRSALGYALLALARIIGGEEMCVEASALANKIKPENYETKGGKLAELVRGNIPLVYSSLRNVSVAYNWKIKWNETGKIPAFYNYFPEVNHNEMTGFDTAPGMKELAGRIFVIFLKDSTDHPQIQKRMDVCRKLYEDRGIKTIEIPFEGENVLERVFNSLLLADWTALSLAKIYGAEPDKVPMVEEFKKLIK